MEEFLIFQALGQKTLALKNQKSEGYSEMIQVKLATESMTVFPPGYRWRLFKRIKRPPKRTPALFEKTL